MFSSHLQIVILFFYKVTEFCAQLFQKQMLIVITMEIFPCHCPTQCKEIKEIAVFSLDRFHPLYILIVKTTINIHIHQENKLFKSQFLLSHQGKKIRLKRDIVMEDPRVKYRSFSYRYFFLYAID